MPVGAWQVYGAAKENLARANIDLDSDTFVMVLLGAGHTPSLNTHATWGDLSANEVSGTGYAAGGLVVAATVTRSAGTITFTTAAGAWASSTITAKYAALIKRAGASLVAADRVLCVCDLENATAASTVSSTAATFAVTPDALGVFTLA